MEWAKASEMYSKPYEGEVGKIESYSIPFNKWKHFGGMSQDPPSVYVTKKMIEAIGDSLSFARYTDESIKADNLWWLQRRLRKGSWVARCMKWDGVYRENKRKGKILRIKKLKTFCNVASQLPDVLSQQGTTLPYSHIYENVEYVKGNESETS